MLPFACAFAVLRVSVALVPAPVFAIVIAPAPFRVMHHYALEARRSVLVLRDYLVLPNPPPLLWRDPQFYAAGGAMRDNLRGVWRYFAKIGGDCAVRVGLGITQRHGTTVF